MEVSVSRKSAAPRPKSGLNGTVVTGAPKATTPWDYDLNWYKSWPDVASTYQSAQAQVAAGDRSGAAATYKTLLVDTRSFVAQDAAFQAARLELAMGDTAGALATVEKGLRRSSANTPFRSQLLSFKADLLTMAGDGAAASAARNEASRLNLERQDQ